MFQAMGSDFQIVEQFEPQAYVYLLNITKIESKLISHQFTQNDKNKDYAHEVDWQYEMYV